MTRKKNTAHCQKSLSRDPVAGKSEPDNSRRQGRPVWGWDHEKKPGGIWDWRQAVVTPHTIIPAESGQVQCNFLFPTGPLMFHLTSADTNSLLLQDGISRLKEKKILMLGKLCGPLDQHQLRHPHPTTEYTGSILSSSYQFWFPPQGGTKW